MDLRQCPHNHLPILHIGVRSEILLSSTGEGKHSEDT